MDLLYLIHDDGAGKDLIMGYNSYVTSDQEIVFSRSLNAREVRGLQAVLEELKCASWFLALDVTEQATETDDGTLMKISADRLVATGNEGKAYELESELQILISALPEDVTASGYIERVGEEFPDAERLHVLGRRVVSVMAEIVWPKPE